MALTSASCPFRTLCPANSIQESGQCEGPLVAMSIKLVALVGDLLADWHSTFRLNLGTVEE